MGFFGSKAGASGFSSSSTAEQVTEGVDGTGLTAIVTGASSGIGIETTRVLAMRGVHVLMAVRNVEAGKKVKEELMVKLPNAKLDVMEIDIGKMASVRKFASEFISSGLPLNILINNAGIYGTPFTLSEDGIELQFATNHIGTFLLTTLLLDTMKKTARESKIEGRIVNVASDVHKQSYPEGIRFEKINDKSGYNNMAAYGQSKLAMILATNELARRLKAEGVDVTVNSLHPGVILTNILRHHVFLKAIVTLVSKLVLKSIPQGAATQCYVAMNPQVKGVSGEYFEDCNKAKASDKATDAEYAKKLWDFTLNLIEAK